MPGRRRWDDDARGVGESDARAWATVADTIAGFAAEAGWVAEEPERHLLPHLEAAAAGGPLAIRSAAIEGDGTYAIALAWVGDGEPTRRAVRSALFALVAGIAETVTVVQEPPEAGGRVLEILTGSADSAAFAGHGHTLRLTVSGTAPRPRG